MFVKPNNYGLLVEKELIAALDGKRYMSLSANMKTMCRDMFGVISPFDKIHCEKCQEFIKPDILITIKNRKRYVSVKSSNATTMHSELVSTVIPFLRECGLDEKSLKTVLYYQFGDKTLDGTGKRRMDYYDTYEWLKNEIRDFNNAVHINFEIVKRVFDRMVFQGVDANAPKVDYIYVGDAEYGIAVSRKQILRHLQVKTFMFYHNMHIGPLLLRPHAKYAHTEIKNQYSHNRLDFYWPKFQEDMEYIRRRYSNDYGNDD